MPGKRPNTVAKSQTAIEYINKDITNIKTELQTLNKLVRDGNGQPSLLQQVNTIGNDLKHIEKDLKESMADLKKSISSHHQQTMDTARVSWQYKATIGVAVISSITSIILQVVPK